MSSRRTGRGAIPFLTVLRDYRVHVRKVKRVQRYEKSINQPNIAPMKVIEILKMSRISLEMLQKACISIKDCRYIDLYEEYEKMVALGHKITYVVTHLSEKYEISERQIYYIIRKFGCDCNIDAAV